MKLSFAALVSLAVLCTLSAAFRPNPCPIPFQGASKCKDTLVCGVKWWRRAKCVKPPAFKPACICITLFDPVCCRARSGRAIVTQTVGNACLCGCQRGKILFNGDCGSPPTTAPCVKIFRPTCCYILKFDLTYTSSSSCLCKAAGGIVISKRACKHWAQHIVYFSSTRGSGCSLMLSCASWQK